MIGRLRGTLVHARADRVIIDTHGVGYEAIVTPGCMADLPGIGEEVVLHTHLHVREDDLSLYAFPSERERLLFKLLIGASGIGPKLAMAMLSTMRPEEIQLAVVSEDADALTVVPGVGKRSAQKIILELRPRFTDAESITSSGSDRVRVREALEGLGYQPAEIRDVVSAVPGDLPLQEALRWALRELDRP